MKIFEPFWQGAQENKKEGVSLGLAISTRQVELMGGELSVESSSGVGSQISFVIKSATGGITSSAVRFSTSPNLLQS
ncbi:ATP-binding protein [Candidatus Poribacteria bacterium]|nr:ATP-binding protein [Candidatus Poribacteria bacterium]